MVGSNIIILFCAVIPLLAKILDGFLLIALRSRNRPEL